MRRSAWCWAVAGTVGALGLGTAGVRTAVGQAQAPPPPPPGAQAQVIPQDLGATVRQMGDQVRALAEAIAANLKNTPRGGQLLESANELARAVDDFRDAVNAQTERFQLRQAYSGVDASWHHLARELAGSGATSQDLNRAVRRVGQADAQLHEALAMNDAPAGYYAGDQAASGMAELQRLVHALVDRADALAAVVRADMVGPGNARVVQDAVILAQDADIYHDALKIDGKIDDIARSGFAGVSASSDRLQQDFRQSPPTARVQAAFQNFRAAEVLIRRALGLSVDPDVLAGTALASVPAGGLPPLVPLADQLVQQVTAFLQAFGPTAGAVPEGGVFLADAQALQAAATDFRQDAGRNLTPGQLAFEFRDVDALWQRLARRTNRIARGRTGPNIQQVARMGQTIADIHRLLGVPGYPPVIALP